MKKIIVLILLALTLAGCEGTFRQDDTGNSPFMAGIDIARKVNIASAPVNPYFGIIEAGLGATVLLAGGYAAMKRKDAIVANTKYQAHKQGTQAFMNKNSGASELYDEIGKARAGKGIT
jgi:hypothetical protein